MTETVPEAVVTPPTDESLPPILREFTEAFDEGKIPRIEATWAALAEYGYEQNTPDGYSAMILLLSLLVSDTKDLVKRRDRLVEATGLPVEEVQLRIDRMRWNGIYHKGGMAIDWFEDLTGMAFIVDATVAAGKIRRFRKDGEYLYQLCEPGVGVPVFPRPPKRSMGWSPWNVARGLIEQHAFPFESALIIVHYGWLMSHRHMTGNWYTRRSTNLMRYWINRCKRWPDIPENVAKEWKDMLNDHLEERDGTVRAENEGGAGEAPAGVDSR